MKTINITVLDVEFPYEVPVDATEFDQLAKRVGACNDEATKNILYRGTFSDVRSIVLHGADEVKDAGGTVILPALKGLEETTKIARKTKKVAKGDKEVETYDETEDDFFGRIAATEKKERSAYLPLFLEARKYAPFDPSARERKPAGPKKLPEKYRNLAAEFLSGAINPATKKPRNLAGFLTVAEKQLSTKWEKTGDTVKDTESLGWYLKSFADAQDVFSKVG